MRCPKCGYNSFDHLSSCKKCGKDLLEYKQRYGIKSVLFPGQMKPPTAADAETDSSVVDAAVAAATGAAAGSAVAGAVREPFTASTPSSEADDFGFDFMGESEDEEDLSFDELFEEAPVDEDVEETLPGPKPAAAAEDVAEFSFDSAAEDEPITAAAPAEAELDDDFGFDLDDNIKPESGAGGTDELAPDDFTVPPADEEDFDFNSDELEFDELEEDAGTEGDPKAPFELPESPQHEGAPEQNRFFFTEQSQSAVDDLHVSAPAAEPSDNNESVEDDFAPVEGFEPPGLAAAFEAEAASEAAGAASVVVAAAVTAEQMVNPTEDPTPAAELVDRQQKISLLPPLLSRVGAFICDLGLLSAVSLSFIVAAETAMSGSSERLLPSFATLIDLSIPYFLVLFSLAFGYFTLFHFLVGQTPGKMLAGLRVETLEGEPLIFSQAFLRSVGGLLQLLPAGLGFLAILIDPQRRGWNDQLAGTRLVVLAERPVEI